MKIFKTLFLVSLLASMLGCGSSSNNAATTTATYGYNTSGVCVITSTGVAVATTYCSATSTYSYNSSGVCIITSTGVAVATTYCSSTVATTYSYNTAGNCIITSTGVVVATTYCSSTSTTSCVGTYYYCPYGISAGLSYCQSGYCNGTNCRGYTMYTSAMAPIVCQ